MMVSRTVAFVFPEGQEMVPRGQVFNFTGVSKRWIDFVWFLFEYGLDVKKTMVLIVFHALCSIWTVTNPGFFVFQLGICFSWMICLILCCQCKRSIVCTSALGIGRRPQRLTGPLNGYHFKRNIVFQTPLFREYVSFRGCINCVFFGPPCFST